MKNRLFLTLIFVAILLLSSFFIPVLEAFRLHFSQYAKMVWGPLLIGFFFGGLIEVYIPRSYILKSLADRSRKTILKAAALGLLFSGCSHGCLAIAFELYKKGASVPAVISFLIASPWTNFSITILLFSFFGIKGGLIFIAAFFLSIITGWTYLFLDKKGLIEKNLSLEELPETFSIFDDLKKRWKNFHFNFQQYFLSDLPMVLRGGWQLIQMISWWILVGMVLASLIGGYFPTTIFQRWMGKGFLGLSVTLGLATVTEICSEGSAPLAFEIYRQTHAFGNAFLFLMSGVITDYTEIGLLWHRIGKKTVLWFLTITIPLTFLVAILFNLWF